MCWNLLRCVAHPDVGVHVAVYRSDSVTRCPVLSKQISDGSCVCKWTGWGKWKPRLWILSRGNTSVRLSRRGLWHFQTCMQCWMSDLKWHVRSPAWSLSVPSLSVFQMRCSARARWRKAPAAACWGAAVSGRGWQGVRGVWWPPEEHKSWAWKARWLCRRPSLYLFSFLSFSFFLQRLKTSPVIYALRDTFVNPVNKPFLVSLCNDKRRSSSSCSHVYRKLVSYQSLLHMLCRWEENGFAVLFEIQ